MLGVESIHATPGTPASPAYDCLEDAAAAIVDDDEDDDGDEAGIAVLAGKDASIARDQAPSCSEKDGRGCFDSWETVERAGYLASAPVSSPMILLTQMAHLCSDISSFAATAALGHSQGTAAAIVAAMACKSDGIGGSFSSGSASASSSASTTKIPDQSSSAVIERFTEAAGRYARYLLYTSPSPRDATLSRMPSSA